MTSLSLRLLLIGVGLAGVTALAAADADAQGVQSNVTTQIPGGVNGGSNSQSIKGMTQAPTVTVLGLPVVVNSPVRPPYDAEATYSTYQGQPANGTNAMLAATALGTTP